MLPTHSPHRLESVSPSRILSGVSSPRRSRLSASPSTGSLLTIKTSPLPVTSSSSLPSVTSPASNGASGFLHRRKGLVLPDPKKLRLVIAGIVMVVLVAYLFLTRAPGRTARSDSSSFSWSNIFPQSDRYLAELPRPVKTDDSRTFLPVIPKRAARHIVAVHSNDPDSVAKLAEEKAWQLDQQREKRRESMDAHRIAEERRRFEAQAVAKAIAKHHAALSGATNNEALRDDDDDGDDSEPTLPVEKPLLDATCFFVRGYKGWTEMPRLLKSIATITEAQPELTIDVDLSSPGLWHATLEKLLKGLPSAAQNHREGPLIWAGCPGTPKHQLLYLPTTTAFLQHLKDQGFIDSELLE